jgi:hypothetical protein
MITEKSSNNFYRAWRIVNLAVRTGVLLGINMNNSCPKIADFSQEARYRVWWCLYILEHMLGVMTGRPTCIPEEICTSPLPMPFEESQQRESMAAEVISGVVLGKSRINNAMTLSRVLQMPLNPVIERDASQYSRLRHMPLIQSIHFNFGLAFTWYCDLTLLNQEIISSVFSADSMTLPWVQIESRIAQLKSRINVWYLGLPAALNFAHSNEDSVDQLRCKVSLALQYYSAQIMLGHAYIFQRNLRNKSSPSDATLKDEMAMLTIDSASGMLSLVMNKSNAFHIYHISPWWCILHYLTQVANALLFELSCFTVREPKKEQALLMLTIKAIRCLHAISKHSIATWRAWQLCDITLSRLATKMGYDINNISLHLDQDLFPHSASATMDQGHFGEARRFGST